MFMLTEVVPMKARVRLGGNWKSVELSWTKIFVEFEKKLSEIQGYQLYLDVCQYANEEAVKQGR